MTVECNLILVHQPFAQDAQDFFDIAAIVEQMAPDIKTYVAYNDSRNVLTRKKASALPTLIFSPGELDEFCPRRGKIYAGGFIPKSEQMRRFAEAGLPVPPFAFNGEDVAVRADLSDFVLVKPDHQDASRGEGIQLRRRKILTQEIAASAGKIGHDFIVQKFVDTGPYPSNYRVHSLFGEPLLAFKKTSTVRGPDRAMPDVVLHDAVTQARRTTGQRRELCRDEDVLALARQAYVALPEIPLHGCDIIRDCKTGQLFLLEINAGGNTWVFSKSMAQGHDRQAELRKSLGITDLTEPFDAFRTAARVLIEKTRAEAE